MGCRYLPLPETHYSIAANLREWVSNGFPEVGDTGGSHLNGVMKMIIDDDAFTANPSQVAADVWTKSSGKFATNGSLIRSSIIGAIPDPVKVARCAAMLSVITHVDPRCVAACVLQSTLINAIVHGDVRETTDVDSILRDCISVARRHTVTDDAEVSQILDAELSNWTNLSYTKNICELRLDDISKMDYVFKSLSCSIYVMHVIRVAICNGATPSFKKVITKIVGEGGNASANASCAGAILGAYLGYSGIPREWVDQLPNRDWLNQMIMKFVNGAEDPIV